MYGMLVCCLTGLLGCWYAGGVRKVTVQVEDELWRQVKLRSFNTGVSLTEVVQRLLRLYADEKINVRPREEE